MKMIKNATKTGKLLAMRKEVGAQVEAWVAEAMHGQKSKKTLLIVRPIGNIRVTVETTQCVPSTAKGDVVRTLYTSSEVKP